MTSKQNTKVVHRLCRGRTLPDSKNKTDSGCFVDEEIEKLNASVSSSAKQATEVKKQSHTLEGNNCLTDLNQNSRLQDLKEDISSDISVQVNNDVRNKERAMSNETNSTQEETTCVTSTNNGCLSHEIVQRRSSDFYCLYYSDSPEATLRRPQVPPKPKSRRISAPLLSTSDNPVLSAIEEPDKETSKHLSVGVEPSALGSALQESLVRNERPKSDSIVLQGLFDHAVHNGKLPEMLNGKANQNVEDFEHDEIEGINCHTNSDNCDTSTSSATLVIPDDNAELSSREEGMHFHTEMHIPVNISDHIPLALVEDDHLSSTDEDENNLNNFHTEMNLNVRSRRENGQFSVRNDKHLSEKANAQTEMFVNVNSGWHQENNEQSNKQGASTQHVWRQYDELSLEPLCSTDNRCVNGVLSEGFTGGMHDQQYSSFSSNNTPHKMGKECTAFSDKNPELWDETDGLLEASTHTQNGHRSTQYYAHKQDEQMESNPGSSVLSKVKGFEQRQDHNKPDPAKRRPGSIAGYPGFTGARLSADMHASKHRSWPVSDAPRELNIAETGHHISSKNLPDASHEQSQERTVMTKVQRFEKLVPEKTEQCVSNHPGEGIGDPDMWKPGSVSDKPTGDLARLLLKSIGYSDRTIVQDPDVQEAGDSDNMEGETTILPSSIVAGIKRDLLSELVGQHRVRSRGERPGSFAEYSNHSVPSQTSNATAWKRRSWSVCDETTQDLASPFVHKVYQLPSAKLTASQQSRDRKLSPFVRSARNTEAVQRRHSSSIEGQQSFKLERSHSYAGRHVTQQPRGHPQYWSDNSSVSSEPEFPQRVSRQRKKVSRMPESIQRTYDNSSASEFSSAESEQSFSSSTQDRWLRNSLNSRNHCSALQQDSSEYSDGESEVHKHQGFRPVSPAGNPQVQRLRKAPSTTCSSSSDSEVERYFTGPAVVEGQDGQLGIAHPKISAMEALFGGNSPRTPIPDSEDLLCGFGSGTKTLARFERLTACEQTPEGLLAEVENKTPENEPRLEFDDTDYSEFYTRCEDKQSILTAEAIHVKELLGMMNVAHDSQIEPAVAGVTETRDASPVTLENENEACKPKTDKSTEPCSVAIQTEVDYDHDHDDMYEVSELRRSRKQNRGTQTPPPYPSARRTFSPASCDRGAQTPSPAPSSSKAISAEELLELLSSLSAGNVSIPAARRPSRKSLSVQKYDQDFPAPQARALSTGNISGGSHVPSSWHRPPGQRGQRRNNHIQSPVGCRQPSLYSQSYDCIRRDLFGNREKNTVGGHKGDSMCVEDDLQKFKHAKAKPDLFEEEIDCMKAKAEETEESLMNRSQEGVQIVEKPLSISFEGSEPTERIEAEVKLAGPAHSLKRKRAGKAFVEEEEEEIVLTSAQVPSTIADNQVDKATEEGDSCPGTCTSEQNDTGDDSGEDTSVQESGVSVFIDYRKKNVMHIVCSPPESRKGEQVPHPEVEDPTAAPSKPEPVEQKSSLPVEVKLTRPDGTKKDLYSIKEESNSFSDADSIGEASSSSLSSDDDAFGEFSGSNETVIFVDTSSDKVPDSTLLDSVLGMGIGSCVNSDDKELHNNQSSPQQGMSDLDAILGEVRKSLDLEFLDSDFLDQAIERFKQRVSPTSQDKVRSVYGSDQARYCRKVGPIFPFDMYV